MATLSTFAANAAANAVAALLTDGYLRIYGGSRPSSPEITVGAARPLAELRFGSLPFDAAVDGAAVTTGLSRDFADESGRATWFRAVAADRQTVILDGSVGLSGADLNLSNVEFTAGAEVTVSLFRYAQSTR